MIMRRDIWGNMRGGAVAAGLLPSPLAAVRFDRRMRGFDITQAHGGVVPVFIL